MRAAVVCLLAMACSDDRLDQCSGVDAPCVTFHLTADPVLQNPVVTAVAMWISYNGARNSLVQTAPHSPTPFPIAIGLQLPNNLSGPTKVRIEALTGPGPAAYRVLSVQPMGKEHLDLDVVMADPAKSGCFNGGKDSGETDLDCGLDCPPCTFSRRCLSNTDCQSSTCNVGVCQ